MSQDFNRLTAGPVSRLKADGYAFLAHDVMRTQLTACGGLDDWAAYAASWSDLRVDTYMADGGRYRRRRHGHFTAFDGQPVLRGPHAPHYQALDYNPLNGGVQRWFEPMDDAIANGATNTTVLAYCRHVFERLSPERDWAIELHQFRIEARRDERGQPTPEGLHRDGVDFVLVLLINRVNIASGTTTIHGLDKQELGAFTLTEPFDAALVDDHRVYHGVTAVTPLDPILPAYRDVLVVTFRALATR
jgi:hypothetical protein